MTNREAQTLKKRSWTKEAAIQIGSGGSAGFVEVCIMHPMDLVKTRFQLQVKTKESDATYYTGWLIEIINIILSNTTKA